MPQNSFYIPTDVDLLRMENELLAFEVRFLKARLNGSASGMSRTSLSRLHHLEEAEKDLELLLRRLVSSPLGHVLRRSSNFRTLEQRYLDSTPENGPRAPSQRLAYLEGAERDLQMLLRRLGKGPVGMLLRRRRSFRTLEDRYL